MHTVRKIVCLILIALFADFALGQVERPKTGEPCVKGDLKADLYYAIFPSAFIVLPSTYRVFTTGYFEASFNRIETRDGFVVQFSEGGSVESWFDQYKKQFIWYKPGLWNGEAFKYGLLQVRHRFPRMKKTTLLYAELNSNHFHAPYRETADEQKFLDILSRVHTHNFPGCPEARNFTQ
jgi:hypothetical protein